MTEPTGSPDPRGSAAAEPGPAEPGPDVGAPTPRPPLSGPVGRDNGTAGRSAATDREPPTASDRPIGLLRCGGFGSALARVARVAGERSAGVKGRTSRVPFRLSSTWMNSSPSTAGSPTRRTRPVPPSGNCADLLMATRTILPSSSFRRTASTSIGIGGGVRRRGGIPVILPLRSDTAAADGDPGNVGLERRQGKPEAIVSGARRAGLQGTRRVRRRWHHLRLGVGRKHVCSGSALGCRSVS